MSRKLWVPVLVGLLAAVLVGPKGVTAVEPRVTTSSIMIPAGAFVPTTDDWDYFHPGSSLALHGGYGNFTAPVWFPVQVVNIKRITVYAYDDDVAASVCVILLRARPAQGVEDSVGNVCTVDGGSNPAALYTTVIESRRVNTALQAPYLWASFDGPGVELYGVKITYSYEA